jgi:pectinesterase
MSMYKKMFLLLSGLVFVLSTLQAQTLRNVQNDLSQDPAWYGCPESINVAETVLLLQHDNGGWPKNIKIYKNTLSAEEKSKYAALKSNEEETTIDNSATYSEMLFMAKMFQATKKEAYKVSFSRGLDFLYSLQYNNGGFKQYARNKGYYTHITYNDNAMLNVMLLLRAVVAGSDLFKGMANDEQVLFAKASYDKGIQCILKTQYIQNGKRTVWCAQHDEVSLLPAKARAYELPSLSGSESVGLLQLLMDVSNPDQEVKDAIVGAVEWFELNRIKDHRVESFTNDDGKPDLRWVLSTEGDDLWGRFCDLNTNKPFVCDRDGIIKYDLSEIGYERRNGYAWYTSAPLKVLKSYEKWKKEYLNKSIK